MSQYSSSNTETRVNVTKNSPTVIGVGTEWIDNVKQGDAFTVRQTNVIYDVSEVISDTELKLSSPYRGNNKNNAVYTIHRDFTVPDNIPELTNGDIETGTILRGLARRVQSRFNELTGLDFKGQWQQGVDYTKFDIVTIEVSGDPSLFIANIEHTSNLSNKPPNTNFWNTIFTAQDIDTVVFAEMNWRGDWQPQTQYFNQNVVRFEESIYIAVVNNFVSGNNFDPNNWEYLINIDELKQIKEDAEAAKDLAEKWASAPQNQEVQNGLFSAFHYALEARDAASGGNVIYVSNEGSDLQDGKSPGSALATIRRALNVAKLSDELNAVKVFPGIYVEEGELEVPPNTALTSEGGQFVTEIHTTDVQNGVEVNMLLLNSGSYVQGFGFRGLKLDSFEDPTKGFAVAFAPNATIVRSPYFRDSSQLSNYFPENIAASLDPENANPLVGKGGGMILADRSVINANSIFTYMLAFGATPRSPNGIGYCAKNGAGINGISSITIFSRISFLSINGGQITLNNSGTQFGDISMKATGSLPVVNPTDPGDQQIFILNGVADIIEDNKQTFVDNMWDNLVNTGRTDNYSDNDLIKVWAPDSTQQITESKSDSQAIEDNINLITNNVWNTFINNIGTQCPNDGITWSNFENFVKRDTRWLLTSLSRDLLIGSDKTSKMFVEGLFSEKTAQPVFDSNMECGFLYSYDLIESEVKSIVNSSIHSDIESLIKIVKDVVDDYQSFIDTTSVFPENSNVALFNSSQSAVDAIDGNIDSIIDEMWIQLVNNGSRQCKDGIEWESPSNNNEQFTKRDAKWLITAIRRDFQTGTFQTIRDFVQGLFDRQGNYVFDKKMLCAFFFTYRIIQNELEQLINNETDKNFLNEMINILTKTLENPQFGTIDREALSKRDGKNLLRAISFDVRAGTRNSTKGFVLGLFNWDGSYIFPSSILDSVIFAQNNLRGQLLTEMGFNFTTEERNVIFELFGIVTETLQNPDRINFGSLIESLGHQFNNAGAGVNRNALPLNFRRAGQNRVVPFTIVQENGGRVRWSGSDELNNQFLAGGTRINGLTGKIEGRPFDSAVRQIARRIANTRGGL